MDQINQNANESKLNSKEIMSELNDVHSYIKFAQK